VEHQPPACPQQPGGFGDPADRVAPQAGPALRHGQIEAARRQRDIARVRLDEREEDTGSLLAAPGRLKLGGVTSTPVGRAPRPASQAEKYAVPQPNSTASKPRTSPSTPSCCSGTLKMPHVMSPASQAR
jgi:hypothetical protein